MPAAASPFAAGRIAGGAQRVCTAGSRLFSDEASFVTGAALAIDGGFTAQ